MFPTRRSATTDPRRGHLRFFLLPLLLLVAAVLVAGCGGKGKESADDVVLATVDDTPITAGYYKDRLARMKQEELPRGDDGQLLDTATPEGKRAFLDNLINKEVMVITATKMGYDRDPQVAGAREALTSYEAGLLLWERVIGDPASTISNEELDDFYAKMGSSRQCRYLITNFREDADAARQMALDGADWDDVVAKYHCGEIAPGGGNKISVPYGRYAIEFEDAVFGTDLGEVTPVVKTTYGFWVLKVDEEKPGKKPPLEEAKAEILDVTRNRKISRLKDDYRKEVYKAYDFVINEDALWKCYLGLPEGEEIFKPGTKDPVPKEDLEPLSIEPADLDLVFYSYTNPEKGPREYTLGDYKAIFDDMSVFQRPKKAQLLGGLRSSIETGMNTTLFNFRAKELGLYEDPAVVNKVDLKIEEMIVQKLYNELVSVDERVSPEDLDAFWAEHSGDYYRSEKRAGRLLLASDEAKALEAKAELEAGKEWREVLLQYGTDKENKDRSGKLEMVEKREGDPISTALFALQEGEVSAPFDAGDGRFGVVVLDGIEEGRPVQLSEIREAVGTRIRNIRKDEAFNALLDKWREDCTIVVHEDELADLPSWEELTAVETPENLVPRNS